MISIVTPTYNSARYLEQCIRAVKEQTFTDYEHIIVDGGSTDGTLEIIRKYDGTYPMRWVSEPDKGMYDAIQKGFSMAKGDIGCWLNSDDIYMPWALKTVDAVMQDEKIEWLMGIPSNFNADGMNYCTAAPWEIPPMNCIRRGWMEGRKIWAVQQESSFWRMSLYQKVGGIDPKYRLAGDYHLWVAFSKYAVLYHVNSILAGFRIHTDQLSANREAYYSEIGPQNRMERLLSRHRIYKRIVSIYKKMPFSGYRKEVTQRYLHIERLERKL